MRLILPIAVLLLAGCDVDNDPANETVTVQYDRERIKESAEQAGRTAKGVATGVANVAESTGEAIEREVGDVDVDVDVKRTRTSEPAAE